MTAEVAILNRSAIALAADSAMTFGQPGNEKIYPVNKLFTLSKFHPVGIMIYNNSDHMGIPLETIVKMYRELAWDKQEKTIQDYATKFFAYLHESQFCTKEQISNNVKRIFYSIFYDINIESWGNINELFSKTGVFPRQAINRIIKEHILKKRKDLEKMGDNDALKNINTRTIITRYESEFNEAVDYAFDDLPINQSNKRLLRVLARLAVAKNHFTDAHTGIVITGFGENEMFPSLIEVYIDGVIDDQLKILALNHVVGRSRSAAEKIRIHV